MVPGVCNCLSSSAACVRWSRFLLTELSVASTMEGQCAGAYTKGEKEQPDVASLSGSWKADAMLQKSSGSSSSAGLLGTIGSGTAVAEMLEQ